MGSSWIRPFPYIFCYSSSLKYPTNRISSIYFFSFSDAKTTTKWKKFGFPCGSAGKESDMGDLGLILGWEDPLEEGLATHSIILTWRISMDRGACQATIHGVTKNWTQLNN